MRRAVFRPGMNAGAKPVSPDSGMCNAPAQDIGRFGVTHCGFAWNTHTEIPRARAACTQFQVPVLSGSGYASTKVGLTASSIRTFLVLPALRQCPSRCSIG